MQAEGLFREVGLDPLPQHLAQLLTCAPEEAIARACEHHALEPIEIQTLFQLFTVRDMALISRTAAAVSVALSTTETDYDTCCRTALCYAVSRMEGHVFSALRAAANKHDDWAQHHYLYGLTLGCSDNLDRARFEFGLALRYEPYEERKIKIRAALDYLDHLLHAGKMT